MGCWKTGGRLVYWKNAGSGGGTQAEGPGPDSVESKWMLTAQ
jgi:hypothetical protein